MQQHSRKVFEAIGNRASTDWKNQPQSLVVGEYVVHDTHKFRYLEDLAPDYTVTKMDAGFLASTLFYWWSCRCVVRISYQIYGQLAVRFTFCRWEFLTTDTEARRLFIWSG